MKRTVTSLLFAVLGALQVSADELPQPGDFYIISRDKNGEFVGSHKIFNREAPGLHLVTYCNRQYWVRPFTVAWTQIEVQNKRIVRVEFNQTKGWRPICERPEQQVTLKDLGIQIDPSAVERDTAAETNSQALASRFGAIGDAFRK